MPLIIGTTNIGDIYKGTTKIDSVYKGTTLVYTSGTWEEYLYEFIYYSLVPTTINSKQVKNRAKVNTIYGNSVVENQLAKLRNITANGFTLTIENNGSGTLTGTPTNSYASLFENTNIYNNHIYLIDVDIKQNTNNLSFRFGCLNVNVSLTNISSGRNTKIITANNTILSSVGFADFTTNVNIGTINAFYQIIDLTQMFPINTPTTLTDTRVQALLNRGYIPYNTGEIKSVDVSEISSTNADTTPLQTLSFKYQGSGVGTAHDTLEITSSAYVFTKNMNRVDLGSLDYNYSSATNSFWSTTLDNLIATTNPNDLCNLICSQYITESAYNLLNGQTNSIAFSMTAIVVSGNSYIPHLRIRDTAYTDPTTFKTAMSGVILEYQLATPQVISIPKKHLGIAKIRGLSWTISTFVGINVFRTDSLVSTIALHASDFNTSNWVYCSPFSCIGGKALTSSDDLTLSTRPWGTNGNILIVDKSINNTTDFINKYGDYYIFYETENEVADIPISLGVESGGTLTTDSDVLPNILMEIKCK